MDYCELYLFTGGKWGGSGESDSYRICSGWMKSEKLEKYVELIKQWPNITQPSFNCENAKTNVEILICSNEQLSRSDVNLTNVYKKALENLPKQKNIKRSQKQWLEVIRSECKDYNCVLNAYNKRISILISFLDEHKMLTKSSSGTP